MKSNINISIEHFSKMGEKKKRVLQVTEEKVTEFK